MKPSHRSFHLLAVSAVGLLLQGCPGSDDPEGASGAGGQTSSTAGAGGAAAGAGGAAAGAGGDAGAGAGGAAAGTGGGGGAAPGGKILSCTAPGKSCQRPIDFTPTVDFEGQPGQQGCATNAVCQISANQNTGACVLVGCTEPQGDQAIPADLNGSAICVAPYDVPFKGKASEIYSYTVSMSQPPPGGGDINAGVHMRFGADKLEQRTDMEIYGVAKATPSPPETRIFALDAGKSGDYTLRGVTDPFAAPGDPVCDIPITFTGKLVRLHDAAPNLTREFARPLLVGASDKNTVGRDTDRWYVTELSAGQKIDIRIGGTLIIPESKVPLTLLVTNEAGEPIQGAVLSLGLEDFQGITTGLEFTAESAGVYYIKVEHGTLPLPAPAQMYININAL